MNIKFIKINMKVIITTSENSMEVNREGLDIKILATGSLKFTVSEKDITIHEFVSGEHYATCLMGKLTVNDTPVSKENALETLSILFDNGNGSGVTLPIEITDVTDLSGKLSEKADLGSDGKVVSSQLPGFVDQIVEGSLSDDYLEFLDINGSVIPAIDNRIYIDVVSNNTFRWSGSQYIEVSQSLALGETPATAFRGDHGKIAYEHVGSKDNPHEVTVDQIGAVKKAGDKMTGKLILPVLEAQGLSSYGETTIHLPLHLNVSAGSGKTPPGIRFWKEAAFEGALGMTEPRSFTFFGGGGSLNENLATVRARGYSTNQLGYSIEGKSDADLITAGGGSKPLSDLSLSNHTHDEYVDLTKNQLVKGNKQFDNSVLLNDNTNININTLTNISDVSSHTGRIHITLPVGFTSHMMNFTVRIFNYVTSTSFDVRISGYNHKDSKTWRNTTAYIVGNNCDHPVVFGEDASGKSVVTIGNESTKWDYIKVRIIDFDSYFTKADDNLINGIWKISISPELPVNVSVTHQDSQLNLYQNGKKIITESDTIANSERSSSLEVLDVRGEERQPSYYKYKNVSAFFNEKTTGHPHWMSGLNICGFTNNTYISWQLLHNSHNDFRDNNLYFRNGITTWTPTTKIWKEDTHGKPEVFVKKSELKFGGVNVYNKSDFTKIDSDAPLWAVTTYTKYEYKENMASYKLLVEAGASRIERGIDLEKGEYTITIFAKAKHGFDFTNFVNATIERIDSQAIDDFYRHVVVFKVPSTARVTIRPYLGAKYKIGDEIFIKNIKIEKGIVSTDWSPSLGEDNYLKDTNNVVSSLRFKSEKNNPLTLETTTPTSVALFFRNSAGGLGSVEFDGSRFNLNFTDNAGNNPKTPLSINRSTGKTEITSSEYKALDIINNRTGTYGNNSAVRFSGKDGAIGSVGFRGDQYGTFLVSTKDTEEGDLLRINPVIGAYFTVPLYTPKGTFESTVSFSDKKLKKNIERLDIEKYFEKIEDIEFYNFEFKKTPENLRFGVIAQEVQKLMPELVSEVLLPNDGENKTLVVNYQDLMVLKIKLLEMKIKNIENRLIKLESLLDE